ncbi:oligosaccharide biosynthesis protein Alg14 like-domain-containing protein [Podospora appendiculata]|uniref:UDP-N-acetylglucosamine transferase subunit ALG14 n=1 Tax=Podospora appendiculata TaxID=314037 RepID=A0AAE1C9C0_9PEZI|nr:oligosaccharide biosynthesis protein Alg14 like-domain-containing protein [Podospora appendiculata]
MAPHKLPKDVDKTTSPDLASAVTETHAYETHCADNGVPPNPIKSQPDEHSTPQLSVDQPSDAEPEVIEAFDVFSEDSYAIKLFSSLAIILLALLLAFLTLSWSWFTALIAVLGGFVVFRHLSITWTHPKPRPGANFLSRSPTTPTAPRLVTSTLPAVYFLYVLGSGGHSAEMIETIKQQFQSQPNQHRRYVLSTGDSASQTMAARLEAQISAAFPDARAGTRDMVRIRRARAVHQPLLSTPLTCLLSAGQAVHALTRLPASRSATRHGYQFQYPHVIVTNGPATGFIVCLVAHLLKILYVVPQNRLRMVYIETWARSRTLSLTGKLFLWTGIADMLCVQHQALARIKGTEYVGMISGPPSATPLGLGLGRGEELER